MTENKGKVELQFRVYTFLSNQMSSVDVLKIFCSILRWVLDVSRLNPMPCNVLSFQKTNQRKSTFTFVEAVICSSRQCFGLKFVKLDFIATNVTNFRTFDQERITWHQYR